MGVQGGVQGVHRVAGLAGADARSGGELRQQIHLVQQEFQLTDSTQRDVRSVDFPEAQ
ncbi:hypothetical protein ACIPM5_34820 [Streptomyces microflavus]|uniref:hypothetical protein n=1 Tax=Streptomyces microflavus TaxID=1919 RepID=UPI0038056139